MLTDAADLVEQLRAATSLDDLKGCLSKIIQPATGGSFTFVGFRGFGLDDVPPYATTVRQDWERHYAHNHLERCDPVLHACMTSATPVPFESAFSGSLSRDARRMMQRARDYGMDVGCAIPCHGGQGTSSLTTVFVEDRPDAIGALKQTLPVMTFCALYAHEQLIKITAESTPSLPADDVPPPVTLSRRETQVLEWMSRGKTAWEISVILHISERTVKFHSQNIMRKLGVHTKSHAIARATALGIGRLW